MTRLLRLRGGWRPGLLLLTGGALAAGPAPGAAAAPPPPTIRMIAASTTDPAIDDVIGVQQVAIGAEAYRVGRLFVFLPGTTASAQMYSTLIERR